MIIIIIIIIIILMIMIIMCHFSSLHFPSYDLDWISAEFNLPSLQKILEHQQKVQDPRVSADFSTT